MANFDRVLQLKILEAAVECYPDQISQVPPELSSVDQKTLTQNISYLKAEGLISGGIIESLVGATGFIEMVSATHHAVNLLSEEGSISASLKVVTVKLHDETLAAVREFINQNVPDPEERSTFLQRLKELPADATKQLVLQLLEKGLGQIPDALHWLQTALR